MSRKKKKNPDFLFFCEFTHSLLETSPQNVPRLGHLPQGAGVTQETHPDGLLRNGAGESCVHLRKGGPRPWERGGGVLTPVHSLGR